MKTIFIANDPWRAHVAEQAGVDRIMVDLEVLGKAERQGQLDTVISRHTLADVERIRSVLFTSSLMVRVNPIHERSEDEISAAIAAGADILMLPMFSSPCEVNDFIVAVRGRTKTCLLFETGGALANIWEVLAIPGIDEVHIGLNDLHLSLGLRFMFELLSGGLVDYMAGAFHERGVKFGVGGVARLGGGMLPAELVLSEHVRIGSSGVILSRDYAKIFDEYPREDCLGVFQEEMRRFSQHIQDLEKLQPEELRANSIRVKEAVSRIVADRIAASGCTRFNHLQIH